MLNKSVHSFMSGLIDYAGLYPPANLALTPAIQNYARYINCDDRWMLARFIIAAGRLTELNESLMALFSTESPLFLSVICPHVQTNLNLITEFKTKYGNKVSLDIIEAKLPDDGFVEPYLVGVEAAIEKSGLALRPFYELTFNEQWDNRLESTIQALARHNDKGTETAVGFKLRCGGVEAHMFPSPAQVSRAIILCRDYQVTMKATAGLHHPVRHFNTSVNTKMHGFLNVFGGGMLAHVHQLNMAELQTIIAEENPAAFTFSTDTFAWHNLAINADQMQVLRQTGLSSYGSCSFDEPREDLQKIGVLP